MFRIFIRALSVVLLALASLFCVHASADCQPGAGRPMKMPGALGGPEVAFDRPTVDFLTQGVQQENCSNMPLMNKSDRPKMLTMLRSDDPAHFRINSPVQEMMPMQLEPHGSLYINICFRADKEKEYHSRVIAVFGEDTVVLLVSGKGVKQKAVGPTPTVLALKVKKSKNRIDRVLELELPLRSTVTLEVQDILGKPVRKLITNELKSAGEYEFNFDWTDDAQHPMPAGTYVIRVEATSVESRAVSHASIPLKLKP